MTSAASRSISPATTSVSPFRSSDPEESIDERRASRPDRRESCASSSERAPGRRLAAIDGDSSTSRLHGAQHDRPVITGGEFDVRADRGETPRPPWLSVGSSMRSDGGRWRRSWRWQSTEQRAGRGVGPSRPLSGPDGRAPRPAVPVRARAPSRGPHPPNQPRAELRFTSTAPPAGRTTVTLDVCSARTARSCARSAFSVVHQ